MAIANGAEKPDLILLDVMMPGMDGYEVCRRLKDIPATRDIPVIFLTAKTEEMEEEKGFDVGAVDYIHKPFSAPIVLARVRTQLALQEALAEAQEARKQADELLHALLPKIVADEIRSIGSVIPRRYENVAVLFCDVTNFTAYCDKHEPEDVVSSLQERDPQLLLFLHRMGIGPSRMLRVVSQNYDQTVSIELPKGTSILGRPAAEAVWLRPAAIE